MSYSKKLFPGILGAFSLAYLANAFAGFLPLGLVSPSVIALLLGMLLHPITKKAAILNQGLEFTAKKLLRLGIILMGASLSFDQVFQVGKISLFVMVFTLFAAFGGGYLLGKLFKMDWRLSSLISAGTGICGGSAVAAIAPVIEADDSYIAYAISATFIFDIIMVLLFPVMGKFLGMSDMGFGLWTGTAVNDTSSVVAAGYAFSDNAGYYAVIVKLTRTLAIVPIVLIFSLINKRLKSKNGRLGAQNVLQSGFKSLKAELLDVIPWFILGFLFLVFLRSFDIISPRLSQGFSASSKFIMVMALGSIGLRTNFKKLAKSGFIPMLHGFLISALVVMISLSVQVLMGLT